MLQSLSLGLNLKHKLVLSPALKFHLALLNWPTLKLPEEINQQIYNNELEAVVEPPSQKNTEQLDDTAKHGAGCDTRNSAQTRSVPAATLEDGRPWYENYAAPVSLQDHLLWQLQISAADNQSRHIGALIIGAITSAGHLDRPIEELAADANATPAQTEKVLKLIQTFEPTGVGARNLQECLMLQARELNDNNQVLMLLQKCWDLLPKKQIDQIAQRLGWPEETVQTAQARMARLDLNPGHTFAGETASPVIPELIVHKDNNGRYTVNVNRQAVPEIRLTPEISEWINQNGERKLSKAMRQKLKLAKELINGLYRREQTLIKVCFTLLEQQKDYFEKGRMHLKPLRYKDVGDKLGHCESTIWNAAKGKWIQVCGEMICLEMFFQRGGNGTLAATSIQERIRQIIADENPAKPLSDQKIAETLKEKGITISCRAVAKYRDAMNIGSTRQRRHNQRKAA